MRQGARNIAARITMLLVIVGAALACLGGTASAAEVHVYSHSFGAGELSLTSQSGIGINRETGEVYVADTKHSRIAKFSGSGTADGSLATATTPTFVAVDNSTGPSKGDIYVVEGEATISKFDPAGGLVTTWGTGGHLTGLDEILGVSVDPAGNLWVLGQMLNAPIEDTLTARAYDPAGSLVTSPWSWTRRFPFGSAGIAAGIAVDSAHGLYALIGAYENTVPVTIFNGHFRKFGPAGETLIESLNALESAGMASDPSNDDVYVGREGAEDKSLLRYSSSGAQLEAFGGNWESLKPRSISEAEKLRLQSIASIAIGQGGSVGVADWKGGQVSVYDLEEVEAPSATIESPDSVTQTSVHIVGHIDPHAPAASPRSHDVVWRLRCTPNCPSQEGFGQETLIEPDGLPQTVEKTIDGLIPGTEYTVTLIAESRGGKEEATTAPFSTAPDAPKVTDNAASEVVRGGATLNAEINPNGAETTYHFEYMTRVAYEAAHDEFAGADVRRTPESAPLDHMPVIHQVSERVTELEPATDYVYRAVAVNSVGTKDGATVEFRSQIGSNPIETDCPNQPLRTEAGARLPDCRAYEMVTPIDKNGAPAGSYEASLQAAPDGSGVSWFNGESATGIPSPTGAHQDVPFYLSKLVGESWMSQRLLAPETLGEVSNLVGMSADEHYALIETAAEGGYEPALYLLDTSDQKPIPIVPPLIGQQRSIRPFSFDGASADDSLFFLESRLQLTANATPDKDNLYVWNRMTGVLSLAGVLPGTKAEGPPGGSFGGAYVWSGAPEDTETGGAEVGVYVGAVHAISESGDQVFFTAGKTGQLYLRRGLTSSKPTTVRVSVANPGVSDPNGEKPAAFLEATPDGSKAFFLSSGRLTQNANTGSFDEGADLYRYEAGAKSSLVDVTPVPVGAGARVQGLLGIAQDGQSGYLVARGVLAAGGVEGDENLYRFEEAGAGQFVYKFVADLPTKGGVNEGNWSPLSSSPKTARVSSDGGTLLFMSTLLNGGANSCLYGSCMEVYRYSTAEESLACLSCNPTGEGPPLIGAELSPGTASRAAVGPGNPPEALSGSLPSSSLPRNLSTSGTRVFFQSSESLLPEDVNGSAPRERCTNQRRCVDVYEWETVGTGSCKTPNQAGGCLYLISIGESGQSSSFIDASADGSSAFILTDSPLVPIDEDNLTDIYDARVDGGLASQHAKASESCASGDACKGSSSSPPPAASPGTAAFQGPGKPKPKKCKKGFVRKHGKCVKKSKASHKKKHHKAKHPKKHRATGKKRSGGAK